ncbi:MAG: hypothetical protein IT293_12605 [Deltaproteobacteria bacterium]|nr:hypothetical protein [Deltaproteobacteria bacterium]
MSAVGSLIERLLDDGALRDRMGAAGRTAVERDFDCRQEAVRLRTILLGALAGTPVPTRPPL